MQTPTCTPAQTTPIATAGIHRGGPSDPTWRCTDCGKLLGVLRDRRMHIRFARGHEYLVGFPVTATCRGCGTLNHAPSPASA